MTIDEAIKKHKKLKIHAERANDKRGAFYSAKEHEQLAEWLEELKFLRQWKSDVMDEFCKYDCNSVEEARNNGYNKALDDFKKILTIEKIKEYSESDGFINLNNCSLMIFDIAEQLKEGGEND